MFRRRILNVCFGIFVLMLAVCSSVGFAQQCVDYSVYMRETGTWIDGADSVKRGTLLFQVDSNQFTIWDFSDPIVPLSISSIEWSQGGDFLSVDIVGNYAVIVDKDYGLRMVNISDLANPFWIGGAADFFMREVTIVGGLAYVSGAGTSFRIYDVETNPAVPEELTFYSTPGVPRQIYAEGDRAFVPCGTAGAVMTEKVRYMFNLAYGCVTGKVFPVVLI